MSWTINFNLQSEKEQRKATYLSTVKTMPDAKSHRFEYNRITKYTLHHNYELIVTYLLFCQICDVRQFTNVHY